MFPFNIGIDNFTRHILLAALCLDKEKALSHFEKVKLALAKIDTETNRAILNLEDDTKKLLAQVYFNLKDVDDSLLEQFKIDYKANTLNGKYYLNIAAQIARVFESNRIPYMFLKGIPIVLQTHQNFGVRPMTDIDVLVPPEKLEMAMQILVEQFSMKIRNYDLAFYHNNIIHAITLRRAANLQVDLHFYFHDFAYHTIHDNQLWATCQKVQLSSSQLGFIPSPSFLLYRTLIHGLDGKAHRWVTDCVALVDFHGKTINWKEIFELAKKQKMLWPVINRLKFLKEEFSIPLPNEVELSIANEKVSILEQIYFFYYSNRREVKSSQSYLLKLVARTFLFLDFHLYKRISEKGSLFRYYNKRKRVITYTKKNFSNKSPYE